MAQQPGFEQLLDFIDNLQKTNGPSLKNMGAFYSKKFPVVNIFEKDGEQTLSAELPGFKKEDITVEVQGYQLRISGKRESQLPDGFTSVHSENSEYEFDRSFKTPYQIKADAVIAKMENGILTLILPRAEGDKAHKVNIS